MLQQLLICALIVYALGLIVMGRRRMSRLVGRTGQWLAGTLLRLIGVIVFTVVDAVITLALVSYHAVTIRRTDAVGDDIAGFLHRLNDRVCSVVAR